MCKILISINEEHVLNILNGTKKFEYRTKLPKKNVKKLVIYCTFPVKKVVAEVEVMEIVKGTPREVWLATRNYSGISSNFYNMYFSDRKYAFAYSLGEVIKYETPLDLEELGVKKAPQSFVYL